MPCDTSDVALEESADCISLSTVSRIFFSRSWRQVVATTAVILLGLAVELPTRAQTPSFAPGVAIGRVDTYDISEASGLIASRQNPGVLWTQNDSGFPGSLFALSTNGAALGRYEIADIYSGDFEDLSFGPGPSPFFDYIYLGDIGDNFLTRTNLRVFRFPEPAAYHFQSNSSAVFPLAGAEEITLSYPDGPHNCEAMLVDPITGDLFLATKNTNLTRIYRAPRAALEGGASVTLTFVHETTAIRSVSGAGISSDGAWIVLRRPGRANLWQRQAGETVGAALSRAPLTIPVIGQANGEPNGEAISFASDHSGYYTLSEGYQQLIYFFARRDGAPVPKRSFVSDGASWLVENSGTPLNETWRNSLDDDWPRYPAPIGYGGGELSTLSPNDDGTMPSIFFRHVFMATLPPPSHLALRLIFNDGIEVSLNGTEILRRNLEIAADPTDYATASNTNTGRTWHSFPVNPALLRNGTNVLAVAIHRAGPEFSGFNFDAQLVEAALEPAVRIASIRSTEGRCTLHLTGPKGKKVHVEYSLDLQDWHPAHELVLSEGAATMTEVIAGARRFYRLAP